MSSLVGRGVRCVRPGPGHSHRATSGAFHRLLGVLHAGASGDHLRGLSERRQHAQGVVHRRFRTRPCHHRSGIPSRACRALHSIPLSGRMPRSSSGTAFRWCRSPWACLPFPRSSSCRSRGRASRANHPPGKLGGVMQGIMDTFRHWKLVLACSAIGSYIGLIPGLGGGPAQWVAYATRGAELAGRQETVSARAPSRACPGTPAPPTTPRKAAPWFRPSRSACRAASPWPFCLGAFIIQGIVPGTRPAGSGQAPEPHVLVRLDHRRLQHHHRGRMPAVPEPAREDHVRQGDLPDPVPPAADLPGGLCRQQRLRRYGDGADFRRGGMADGPVRLAAAAAPPGPRPWRHRGEQPLHRHQGLRRRIHAAAWGPAHYVAHCRGTVLPHVSGLS